ncbi:MAG TPA: response regulator [Desulfobacteraceae bacterium]|jgi:DNA-binding NtrC family response regulator|nr:response regulator [Desulfobacteraceae bacterium]
MKELDILVIDNEDVICDACEMVLTEKGHRVDYYKTGKSGLQAAGLRHYDLVLLDMKLPDMDGMDILRMLKEKMPSLEVVVMTGYSTTTNAVQAMKLGAVDYLSKPFTDDELLRAVENSCGVK